MHITLVVVKTCLGRLSALRKQREVFQTAGAKGVYPHKLSLKDPFSNTTTKKIKITSVLLLVLFFLLIVVLPPLYAQL